MSILSKLLKIIFIFNRLNIDNYYFKSLFLLIIVLPIVTLVMFFNFIYHFTETL